jgi:hypothetical protein
MAKTPSLPQKTKQREHYNFGAVPFFTRALDLSEATGSARMESVFQVSTMYNMVTFVDV